MKHRVLHFERIDSTNLEARRLADQGERGPLWIVADEQTGGRGRLGRTWASEPGNLYATFLFPVSAGLEVAAQVSFVAALAVHDMAVALLLPKGPSSALRPPSPILEDQDGRRPTQRAPSPVRRMGEGGRRPDEGSSLRIKWPNDVLVGGAKFCGVLAEVVGQSPTRIAIGCGVNVAHAPAGTPYPVTSLGIHIELESVLQLLDASLSNRLGMWDEGRGFALIRQAWEERALGIGGGVTASGMSGAFKGLAADGALILELADGATEHIHSGEVSFAELEALRRS